MLAPGMSFAMSRTAMIDGVDTDFCSGSLAGSSLKLSASRLATTLLKSLWKKKKNKSIFVIHLNYILYLKVCLIEGVGGGATTGPGGAADGARGAAVASVFHTCGRTDQFGSVLGAQEDRSIGGGAFGLIHERVILVWVHAAQTYTTAKLNIHLVTKIERQVTKSAFHWKKYHIFFI
jgi:hypothetical protein